MRLSLATRGGTTGLLFKTPAFWLSAKVELEPDEQNALLPHPEARRMIVATGTVGELRTPAERAFSLAALCAGVTDIHFSTLTRLNECEESLRRGCETARERILRLASVGDG